MRPSRPQIESTMVNLLDTEPPLAPGLNDNDYGPGFYGTYDPLGRTVYASLQFDF
jgi:hypothetical protein